MADLTGTHELGPAQGRVLVKTGREGLAARAGHDLTLEITRWSAQLTSPDGGDLAAASLTADLDLGSLTVRAGTGGAKPLSDKDRRDIEKQARKILGASSSARFTATRIVTSPSPAGGGAIEGTIALNGRSQPVRLDVTSPAPGQYRGSAAFKQTSFGITPYSGFLGALKLRDEVTVEFEITIKELTNGSA